MAGDGPESLFANTLMVSLFKLFTFLESVDFFWI